MTTEKKLEFFKHALELLESNQLEKLGECQRGLEKFYNLDKFDRGQIANVFFKFTAGVVLNTKQQRIDACNQILAHLEAKLIQEKNFIQFQF